MSHRRGRFIRANTGSLAWLGVALLPMVACVAGEGQSRQEPADLRLHYVATARQLGPVAYRDPLGSISPDGIWLAYTTGRQLLLQRVDGGPVLELGAADARRTELAWLPDGIHLAAREVSFDRGAAGWFVYDLSTGRRAPVWPGVESLRGSLAAEGKGREAEVEVEVEPGALRHLAWSSEGNRVAGVVRTARGSQLWIVDSAGEVAEVRGSDSRLMFPAWNPASESVACLSMSGEHPVFQPSCAAGRDGPAPWIAYGPFAFSPDGSQLYYAAPDDRGSLDLWVRALAGGSPRQLSRFARDGYAPSVTRDGDVLFKTQDYRVSIAVAPAGGGPSRAITAFQSETPSWNWSGTRIAFTYGDWRRVTDDILYPDIDQHLGSVALAEALPALAPRTVIRSSSSEDQGMHWSPNGRWIVLHSHAGGSDDLWLQPADLLEPAHAISAGGHETGWPRWSPDGRWIVYPSQTESATGRRSVLYLLGIDQTTGEITAPAQQIPLPGFSGDVSMAEWSNDSEILVFEGDQGNGTKALYVVERHGGRPRMFHQFESDQLYSGVSVSPDSQWAAFVAPAADGYFQLHRVPIGGGPVQQVTFDPTDKVHPAYAPDGERIAFTVVRYSALFWRLSAD